MKSLFLPKINNQKRDKLPKPHLIDARSQTIFDYWDASFEFNGQMFLYETADLLGQKLTHWDTAARKDLFAYFKQAVELTAITNAAERWEPVY